MAARKSSSSKSKDDENKKPKWKSINIPYELYELLLEKRKELKKKFNGVEPPVWQVIKMYRQRKI